MTTGSVTMETTYYPTVEQVTEKDGEQDTTDEPDTEGENEAEGKEELDNEIDEEEGENGAETKQTSNTLISVALFSIIVSLSFKSALPHILNFTSKLTSKCIRMYGYPHP